MSDDSALKDYIKNYGGWKTFFTSRYVWASVFITALSFGAWGTLEWPKAPLTALPSIISFSIGSFAIWLGFGSDHFKYIISRIELAENKNGYSVVNSTFVHFILVQATCILYALTFQAISLFPLNSQLTQAFKSAFGTAPIIIINFISSFFGYFLFVYSICLIFAVTLSIYRVTLWHGRYLEKKFKKK